MNRHNASKFYKKIESNAFGQPVGMPVDSFQCSDVEHVHLIGHQVKLLDAFLGQTNNQHIEQLWQVVSTESDDRCWTYLPYAGFESQESLALALKTQFGFHESTHFLIEVNQKIVGWVALMNIRPNHGVIEIGNVYFSHAMKQTTASTEVIYLLLKHSFELGYRRVEWKCDDLNSPSKNAALRFGFQYEGVFRQDRISKGRNRNTAWFSILDTEWPVLSQAYSAWLNPDNFDLNGQQKMRLNDFMAVYAK